MPTSSKEDGDKVTRRISKSKHPTLARDTSSPSSATILPILLVNYIGTLGYSIILAF